MGRSRTKGRTSSSRRARLPCTRSISLRVTTSDSGRAHVAVELDQDHILAAAGVGRVHPADHPGHAFARRVESALGQIIVPGGDHGIETQADDGAVQLGRLPGRRGRHLILQEANQGMAVATLPAGELLGSIGQRLPLRHLIRVAADQGVGQLAPRRRAGVGRRVVGAEEEHAAPTRHVVYQVGIEFDGWFLWCFSHGNSCFPEQVV